MKLGTISVPTPVGDVTRVCVATPEGLVDATAARQAFLERRYCPEVAERLAVAQVPRSLVELLQAEQDGIDWVREAVDHVLAKGQAQASGGQQIVYQRSQVTLLAPIPRPSGMSSFMTFTAHIAGGIAAGASMKFPGRDSDLLAYYKPNPETVSGDGAVMEPPFYSKGFDVECELAAIVGRKVKNVGIEEARQAIAGYAVLGDGTIDRPTQIREMAFGLGPSKTKDSDGGKSLGPFLVTPDEVGDPKDLRMSFHVNGREMSSGSTSDMVWDHAELLSYLSRGQTIHPGHVISSGCFPGGCAHDVKIDLAHGDQVELRISRIGSLHHQMKFQ